MRTILGLLLCALAWIGLAQLLLEHPDCAWGWPALVGGWLGLGAGLLLPEEGHPRGGRSPCLQRPKKIIQQRPLEATRAFRSQEGRRRDGEQ